ncbi:MAG: Fe-S cluster assembly protein SufD [Rhodospirillales bacterium]
MRAEAREPADDALVTLLSRAPFAASGENGSQMSDARRQARDAFLAAGLPTRRDESWRYTDLGLIRRGSFRMATPLDVARPCDVLPNLLEAGRSVGRLVFVNGGFRADLSTAGPLPVGLSIVPTTQGAAINGDAPGRFFTRGENPLVALNTAMAEDGVAICIDGSFGRDVWLELVFLGGATEAVACALRHLVRVGEGARLGIVEHHVALAGEAAFTNSVMQIDVERGASLRHYRLVDGKAGSAGLIISTVRAHAAAEYEAFALIVGGGLNRIETTVELEGARASCRIGGAYAIAGKDICDNTIRVTHCAPKTTSRQIFRGVIDESAHAVFQGRVIVERLAQEADGHQLSKALLLSGAAEIDQKPALEIFADNVKCSHGAAAGQLDPAAMFYLRSRGIPEALARQMLMEGFLAEVLLEVSDEAVRRQFAERIIAAIGERGKEKA